MDRDELIRLCGEQALLQKERSELNSAFLRDKAGLQSFCNRLNTGLAAGGWLDGEIERLKRLHDQQARLNELDARIAALQRMTGL
jgi:hypothetical protein